MKTTIITSTLLAGALAGGVVLASSADAKDARSGGGGVKKSVACSTGTLELKAKADDPNVIEVEAELDTNVVGQAWTWSIKDNGVLVRTGKKVTVAPSGSWTVARTIPDTAGPDKIHFRTVMGSTACTVDVTV